MVSGVAGPIRKVIGHKQGHKSYINCWLNGSVTDDIKQSIGESVSIAITQKNPFGG